LFASALFACGGGSDSGDFDPYASDPADPGNPLIRPGTPPPSPGGGGGGGGGGPSGPTPPGITTNLPIVPWAKSPPIGLTWYVGVTENVSRTRLQTIYSTIVGFNNALWNLTEGQVYLYKVVITDNVAPGTTGAQWEANKSLFSTASLDVVVWPDSAWDIAGAAAVTWVTSSSEFGRASRLVLMPESVTVDTVLHESGHSMWNLTWSNFVGLDDEYLDGVQDPVCVMEATYSPTYLCSSSNHVSQAVQPHSCWQQILTDYTLFAHSGTEKASTSAWVTLVQYNDTP